MSSNGLLSNVHLWVELLELIEELGPRLQWLWPPSHVGLEGNGVLLIANGLAAEGMCQSPLWGVLHSGWVNVRNCGECSGDSTVSRDSSSSGNDGKSSSVGREDFEVMLPMVRCQTLHAAAPLGPPNCGTRYRVATYMQSCCQDMRTVREQRLELARMLVMRRGIGRAKGPEGFWARNSAAWLFVYVSLEVEES